MSSNKLLEKYCYQKRAGREHNFDDHDNILVDPAFLLNKIRTEFRASRPLPTSILQILYCDEHICVVHKPSGVLSVPGPRRNPSMANLVFDTIQPTLVDDVDQTVAHRLDMATSGILIFALSLPALTNLHKAFSNKHSDSGVQKTYQCLVEGHLRLDGKMHVDVNGNNKNTILDNAPGIMDGEIDVALERDPNNSPFMRVAQPRESGSSKGAIEPGNKIHKFWTEAPKPSLTTFAILGWEHRNERPVTRLEMRPWTGRTHQLRVHAAQVLGTPIVGDDIYGGDDVFDSGEQLCLHAQKLCLRHPISGAPMIFEADPAF